MASSDRQFFILTKPLKEYMSRKPGEICSAQSFKLKKKKKGETVDVVFTDSFAGLDYPVDIESLEPISPEEVRLLMAVPEEDRLSALNQTQGLRSARRLREGTEVWVQEGSAVLKGTIRFIGNITEPMSPWNIPGLFYGVELQGSDRGQGSTNGSFKYKQFFSCDKDCGVFAPFNRITAVGPQTSPGPQTKECPDMKPEMRIKSRTGSNHDPRSNSNRDLDQPMSFHSNYFHQDCPPSPGSSPGSSADTCLDSDPKPLSASPESMDVGQEYEDSDKHKPSKVSNVDKFRSKSLKLGPVSHKSNCDRKDKPKVRLDLLLGSTKRASFPSPEPRPESRPESRPETKPETRPESREVDLVKSSSKPDKTRLGVHRSRPQLGTGLRSQADTESRSTSQIGARFGAEPRADSLEEPKPGLKNPSTFELQTGDRVMFFDEKEQSMTGTFLYIEESERGTMAYISRESGELFLVPLVGLMKLEPEAEDIYHDPKGSSDVQFEDSKTECSRTQSRPESKELVHVKSWSEAVKTRSQAEAEPKAQTGTVAMTGLQPRLESRPETRAESRPEAKPHYRPETRQQSPEGPKPGLTHGSTVGLTAGDQVQFLDGKEQVLRGTVVFLEESDEGPVVHIAGDSGASSVPLHRVAKIESQTSSEDLYLGPDSTLPPVERQVDCSSLGLDSVVEIEFGKGEKGFGTIRWIGDLPGVPHRMAGLELEEQRGVSDGTFRGQRFFTCPDKHALFVKLSSVRPDSRFSRSYHSPVPPRESTNNSTPGARPQHNGFIPKQDTSSEFGLDPVPPVTTDDVERLLIGRMKGIQGHHNSCYMDSALFSLFSVSSVLDSLLFKSTSPRDAEVQRILLRDIVNPLRRDGFVEGRHVMNMRKHLQKHGFSQSFTTDEKDPEEFLTVIMQHILNLDPLLKLCSGGKVQDSFCFQIFLDQNQDLVLPSVQQLLEHSFHSNALKLSEVPSCLILQMPRFGKNFKMFDKILPSLELDVTDLLQSGLKGCVLCGGVALWECPDCFLDPTFSANGFKMFCEQCNNQVHTHPRRYGHHPAPLDPPRRGRGEHLHGNRDKLHLLAVLCIETSHYVSFVKYGPEPEQWLFFDSMADREGEADGYNIPNVSLAPELSQYLNMSRSELANQVPRDMKGVAKRLLCDAYLYLYQSPALHLYT